MKKVLWFSNARFSDRQCMGSGTWLGAMSRRLVESGKYRIFNIVCSRASRCVMHETYDGMEQWVVPHEKLGRDGLPSKKTIAIILDVVDHIKPDLVHVWGLENYFGLLVARGYIKHQSLIDIQGIRHSVAKFYMGNLNVREQLSCIGIKEILKPHVSIFGQQRYFASMKNMEVEVIKSFENISYQSDWTGSYLSVINTGARLFRTKRMLRREFYDSPKWRPSAEDHMPVVYASCGATLPYKGLFVALRAIALLKKSGKFPHGIVFKVAGSIGYGWLRSPGYFKWIQKEIRRLGLAECVEFLGERTAAQMCKDLLECSVFVHPSFIESYSLVVAEAMYLGVPSVISYAGAMAERAKDGVSALYFPAGDEYVCADKIAQIIADQESAKALSNAALNQYEDCASDVVLNTQIGIYDRIFEK